MAVLGKRIDIYMDYETLKAIDCEISFREELKNITPAAARSMLLREMFTGRKIAQEDLSAFVNHQGQTLDEA